MLLSGVWQRWQARNQMGSSHSFRFICSGIVDYFISLPELVSIKRIIALPGETMNISDGQVNIVKDGEKNILQEDYLPENLKTQAICDVQMEQK